MDAQERGTFLTHRLTEFQQLWNKYMELFQTVTEKEETEFDQDDELQFRDLQAELLRRTQFLVHRMPPGVFEVDDDVHKLLNQSISLRILHAEPSIKITELKNQWHDVSIALNQMHGQLRAALEAGMSHGKKKKKSH